MKFKKRLIKYNFIIRIYQDALSSECQNNFITLQAYWKEQLNCMRILASSQNKKMKTSLNIRGLRFECRFSSYSVFGLIVCNDNQVHAKYTSYTNKQKKRNLTEFSIFVQFSSGV
jgi:hypothetical protein